MPERHDIDGWAIPKVQHPETYDVLQIRLISHERLILQPHGHARC